MKCYVVGIGLFAFIFVFTHCNNRGAVAADNMKDLDQNMLDLKMYHENLGTHLRKGEVDYSSWLLEGMDSCLQVISLQFDEHRKLTSPFKKAYKKELLPPIINIREALSKGDIPVAIIAYRTLTKNCNGCHIDHEVDKTVLDLSDPAYNE